MINRIEALEHSHPKAVTMLFEEAARKGMYKPVVRDNRTLNYSQYQPKGKRSGRGGGEGLEESGSERVGQRKMSVGEEKKQKFVVVNLNEGRDASKQKRY